ncbi:DUF3885 domain-containing protein [Clostridium sp. AM58-1XD]|uniref:DUF3885 domain-containing protein n=1 Tax=Clostridium sp. AM58-1XD TaxID=2292307 RepID=UPI000E550DA0|nr:DUF3885 domain-containing protein [Clostridium sp. AM58-1XD]
MGKLHKYFENAIRTIGFVNTKLPTAVFYSTPIGIRFEIGGKEEVYLPDDQGMNPVYVKNAFCRAKTLFHDLPCRPNLLRIDNNPEEAGGITLQTLSHVGLPAPDESILERHIDEGACFLQEHLYWDLTKSSCQINRLLFEIIKGDIGGFSCLCSNVYLLNTENFVLYHLYDDRGADIVAYDKHLLLPLYQKYKDWILPYDKARIDQLFAGT